MARPRSALTKIILSFPPSTFAKDVLAQVRAKGMRTTESNVYRVRRTHGAGGTKTQRSSTTPSVSTPRTATPSGAEDLLRAIGAEIGLGRAVEILVAERAKVGSLIRR